jgi:hypothetical protein
MFNPHKCFCLNLNNPFQVEIRKQELDSDKLELFAGQPWQQTWHVAYTTTFTSIEPPTVLEGQVNTKKVTI